MRIDAGQRHTKQRQVIHEELTRLRTHPTASELYETVRRRLPRVSMGTVYRNLELLVDRGLARRIETAGAQARFDGDVSQHYHVRCEVCGRIGDVFDLPTESLPANHETLGGYLITGYTLEFSGVCPECRRVPAEDEAETLSAQ